MVFQMDGFIIGKKNNWQTANKEPVKNKRNLGGFI